jgi:hypothetical protein
MEDARLDKFTFSDNFDTDDETPSLALSLLVPMDPHWVLQRL